MKAPPQGGAGGDSERSPPDNSPHYRPSLYRAETNRPIEETRMSMRTKKAPAGLDAAGRVLWAAVTRDYELSAHELAILTEAARTVDLLTRLEAEVIEHGAVVESPQGRRANPAAVEARQQRITLARLLAALRIPLDDSASSNRTQARPLRGVYGVAGR